HLSPNLLGNEESLARDDVAFVVAPGFNLKLDARFQFVVPGTGADQDHRGFSGVRIEDDDSDSARERLALAHKASSSSGLSCSKGRSEICSMVLKRWRNRRLHPRRAIS